MAEPTLPLAEEIRTARAAAEAAQRARVELAEAQMALQTLNIQTEVHRSAGLPLPPDFTTRSAALEATIEALEAHADKAAALGAHLSHLLSQQHDALHHPGHEDTIIRLKQMGRERQEIWDGLEPVWQRANVLAPVSATLVDHVAELDRALAARGREAGVDSRGREAGVDPVPVAQRSASIVTGLNQALVAIGFEVSVPAPPAADWQAIEVVAERLRELRDILGEEHTDVRARAEAAQARYDALGASIAAITG